MDKEAIVIERVFDAPIAKVWKAITDKDEMKNWYFQLEDFKPQVGFKFQFLAGEDGDHQYLHLCEVTEVVVGKKLSYSWKYDKYPGNSLVSFELAEQGDKTLLRLSHDGVYSFAANGPDFTSESFAEGWNAIVNQWLKGYLESAGK